LTGKNRQRHGFSARFPTLAHTHRQYIHHIKIKALPTSLSGLSLHCAKTAGTIFCQNVTKIVIFYLQCTKLIFCAMYLHKDDVKPAKPVTPPLSHKFNLQPSRIEKLLSNQKLAFQMAAKRGAD